MLALLFLVLYAENIRILFLGDCDDSGDSKFLWLPNLIIYFSKVSLVSNVAIILFFWFYVVFGSNAFSSYLLLIALLISRTSLIPLTNRLWVERVSWLWGVENPLLWELSFCYYIFSSTFKRINISRELK